MWWTRFVCNLRNVFTIDHSCTILYTWEFPFARSLVLSQQSVSQHGLFMVFKCSGSLKTKLSVSTISFMISFNLYWVLSSLVKVFDMISRKWMKKSARVYERAVNSVWKSERRTYIRARTKIKLLLKLAAKIMVVYTQWLLSNKYTVIWNFHFMRVVACMHAVKHIQHLPNVTL